MSEVIMFSTLYLLIVTVMRIANKDYADIFGSIFLLSLVVTIIAGVAHLIYEIDTIQMKRLILTGVISTIIHFILTLTCADTGDGDYYDSL